ncbi:alpha/beta hydrolase [Methylobacterium sp. Leaf118]|uniref:alpha/beta hydrolase n=1 Tax=Methylobacterium sp. Leaf118 TaxID=2876562 RepID=UPI001E46C287|nr:alpha/beta hydrolase [Methylobacterium sp. Leaf118]
MPLDPAIAAFLAQEAGIKPASLAELRVRTDAELIAMQAPPEAIGCIREFPPDGSDLAPPVPIRAYWPGDPEIRPVPAIVFAHGGGWCLGSLDAYDTPCRSLAKATGCVVFSVDYRLAPEHPFPVPLDDVYAALRWVADHAAMLAIDEERLVVAGDSAGGNLAAAAALIARDRAGPKIAHQLHFYPALDIDLDTPSYREFAEGYYLTREVMRFCWETYVGRLTENVSVYAAPGRADVAALPSATVLICEFDPLRTEAESYVQKLKQSGIPVKIVLLEGLIHACLHMTGLTSAANALFTKSKKELREVLSIG